MKYLHKFNKRLSFLLLFLSLSGSLAIAQLQGNPSPVNFPIPKDIPNQLFYLQRDPNTNTIICQLNIDEHGNLNKEQPVNVFWKRYAEKNETQNLNYIQRKFAYGIQSKNIGNDEYLLNFVSYKKLSMVLSKSEHTKKYNVFVSVNNKRILLERIFVRIEGGTFWVPNVRYVEFKGYDVQHPEKVITERIKV